MRTSAPIDAEQLRQSLRTNPAQPSLWHALARAQVQQGKPAEAERAYREALKHNPGLMLARLELAQLLVRNGHPGPGIVQVQELLNQNPADTGAWLVAGEAFRANFQPKEAAMAFTQVLQLNPEHEAAAYAHASLMLAQGQSRSAQKIIDRQWPKRTRSNEQWWQIKAQAQLDVHGPEAACEVLQDALKAHPGSAVLNALLAKVRYQSGQTNWHQLLLAAVREQPANAALVQAGAAALRGAGKTHDAIKMLKDVLKNDIDRDIEDSANLAPLWLELSDCFLTLGEYDSALEAAQAASDVSNSDWVATRQLIDAMLSLGRCAEALPLIRKVRQTRRQDHRWLAAESTALRAMGAAEGELLLDTKRLVWIKDMPTDQWELLREPLIKELSQAHESGGPPLDQSLRGGSQTSQSLLHARTPAVSRLLQYLLASLRQYQSQLPRSEEHPFDQQLNGDPLFVGCWSVNLSSGGFHVNHLHSQGTVSSAFYVSVPNGVSSQFAESHEAVDRAGWLGFGAPRFPVPGVEVKRWVQPRPGRLVLFPSWFWHGTKPFSDPDNRLSVAFDARFR